MVTDDILEELQHALVADKTPWDITVYQRAIDEIERLRADIEQRAELMSKIVELLVPFSMLMNKHEQELLIKAVRGD